MGNFSTCPFREKLIFNHDFKSQSKSASQPVYREPVQGMTLKLPHKEDRESIIVYKFWYFRSWWTHFLKS